MMAEKGKRRELFTVDFWYRTLVRALHSFGAGCLGPLGAHQVNLVGSVPWYGILTSGGIGAAISLFTSMTTIRLEEADEEIRDLERERTKAILREPITVEQAHRPIIEGHSIRDPLPGEDMGKHSKEPPPQDDSFITDIPPRPVIREPLPQYQTESPQPRQEPKPVEPQTDPSIEQWPQGGRRGKGSRRT